MFFRRLNWNVVGWFRTVSLISYAVIFAGVLALAYFGSKFVLEYVLGRHWG